MNGLGLKGSLLFCITLFAWSAFAAPTSDAVTSHAASGVMEKIAADRHTATIHNYEIPGYMAEMTMDFPVQDTNELSNVSPGDIITFNVVVGESKSWIQEIKRTGRTAPVETNDEQTMSDAPADLGPGDRLPDGLLTTEDGRQIHFSDFRGKAVAFTFFYTRCPLPDFCPLMNRNFAAARTLISSTTNAPTNWEFLSISFDPATDTPALLGSYAGLFRGDSSAHWLFAAASTNTLATLAPALDLMIARQGNGISHNLRTVVLDTQGRIYHQFDGNQWTARQLADAILAAARQ
ncbi:MAG TPA: SCO family protein [Pseudomonadales bacterium]|nr:SCO family protein [Pseudomonadales bacterium]